MTSISPIHLLTKHMKVEMSLDLTNKQKECRLASEAENDCNECADSEIEESHDWLVVGVVARCWMLVTARRIFQ